MNKKFWDEHLLTWLSGTTCCHHTKSVAWISSCGRFALLKHHGHSEYCDRVVGTKRCGTYYALRDAENLDPRPGGWDRMKSVRYWEGRWTKAKQKEMEDYVESAI
ncbi:MAG: hypothetical protein DRR04_11600 [Gammaproteobacteria bacterium]|nr:MAG: hypothetical protein DRR04_11600 [Gammaproteobacteria bacterium]